MLNLSKEAAFAITQLQRQGFLAYAVGGMVRDAFMGKPAHDIDITTNATPTEVEGAFASYKQIPTGKKHGTITVLLAGVPVEITTFRVDGEYRDGRHPQAVCYCSSVEQDLARRDFTINAMAYNPAAGLIDPFGGRDDLANGILRTVGDPSLRFGEDALRIMRAFRFMAQLGFSLEKDTLWGIACCKEKLSSISAERIFSELFKLLSFDSCTSPLLLMGKLSILPQIIPPISKETALLCGRLTSPEQRLAALLLAANNPQERLHRLKVSGKTEAAVLGFLHAAKNPIPHTMGEIRRAMGAQGTTELLLQCDFLAELEPNRATELGHVKAAISSVQKEQLCCSLAQLAIGGRDLLACGMNGKQIGEMLDWLFYQVTENMLPNEKQALLSAVKKRIET